MHLPWEAQIATLHVRVIDHERQGLLILGLQVNLSKWENMQIQNP
jgi:hypothetical protein